MTLKIKLKNGSKLLLDGSCDLCENGYFVLGNSAFENPDLSVLPAVYMPCSSDSEYYEIHRDNIVLGGREDVKLD